MLFLKELNLLLKPLATCCSFLNRELFVRLLEETFRRILEIIKKLDKDDFKEKVRKVTKPRRLSV